MARSHSRLAIKVLAGIAKDGTNDGARVAAAVALLDRGWGKAERSQENADIQITVRQLFDPEQPIEKKPVVIDHDDDEFDPDAD